MKLKTLKDIGMVYYNEPKDHNKKEGYYSNTIELRQEAIKHIKKIQKENEGIDFSEERSWGYSREYPAGQIHKLMEFFNITEEDLKEKIIDEEKFKTNIIHPKAITKIQEMGYRELDKERKLKLNDIILENNMEVTIDLNSRSKCKKCEKEIFWAVTKNKKLIPIELVGLAKWDTHYATCPFANEFRKKKK